MNINIIFAVSLLFLAACTRSFDGGYNSPLIYKINIQQGNVIDHKMLRKLKPGMDQSQVKFIMGTPTIIDPFHNHRWEYIYSFQEGGGVRKQHHITLHFKEKKLSHISGDIKISDTLLQIDDNIVPEDKAVIVPKSANGGEGFFGRLWDKVTPGD